LNKSQFNKSVSEGIKSYKSAYVFFGNLVATVALTNFIFSIFNIDNSVLLKTILTTYRYIVHGSIDWVLFPFHLKLSEPIKDLIFFYALLGGISMRSRIAEDIYSDNEDASFKNSLMAFFFEREPRAGSSSFYSGRFYLGYYYAPKWLRHIYDFILWPRVMRQYFSKPHVYHNEYMGVYRTFKSDYKPSHPTKVFQFDRRILFLTQLLMISLCFFLILVLNGFLTSPDKL
jgi:hypothetical protein